MFKLAFVKLLRKKFPKFHNFQILSPKAIQTTATGNTRAFWNTTAPSSARCNYDQDMTKILSSGKLWSKCKEVLYQLENESVFRFFTKLEIIWKPLLADQRCLKTWEANRARLAILWGISQLLALKIDLIKYKKSECEKSKQWNKIFMITNFWTRSFLW